MKNTDVLIKWTGSKRLIVSQIIKNFPKNIKTYYEPFLGSGATFYALKKSNIEVENFVLSDLNPVLMQIWEIIKENPQSLLEFYKNVWPFDKDKYLKIRSEFNEDQNPYKFFCLTRSCRNGLIRYNSKGKFNSAFHIKRKGVRPEKLERTIQDWHEILQDVQLKTQDYREIRSEKSDFVYLDPPYAHGSQVYEGRIDYEKLWDWLGKQKCGWLLSFDGEPPQYLYCFKKIIHAGFQRVNNNKKDVLDNIYLRKCHAISENWR